MLQQWCAPPKKEETSSGIEGVPPPLGKVHLIKGASREASSESPEFYPPPVSLMTPAELGLQTELLLLPDLSTGPWCWCPPPGTAMPLTVGNASVRPAGPPQSTSLFSAQSSVFQAADDEHPASRRLGRLLGGFLADLSPQRLRCLFTLPLLGSMSPTRGPRGHLPPPGFGFSPTRIRTQAP